MNPYVNSIVTWDKPLQAEEITSLLVEAGCTDHKSVIIKGNKTDQPSALFIDSEGDLHTCYGDVTRFASSQTLMTVVITP